MKNKIFFLLIITTIFLLSCNTDNYGEYRKYNDSIYLNLEKNKFSLCKLIIYPHQKDVIDLVQMEEIVIMSGNIRKNKVFLLLTDTFTKKIYKLKLLKNGRLLNYTQFYTYNQGDTLIKTKEYYKNRKVKWIEYKNDSSQIIRHYYDRNGDMSIRKMTP